MNDFPPEMNQRKRLGRPRHGIERKLSTSVYITATEERRLRELGNDNLSAGVLRALANSDLWLTHIGTPPPAGEVLPSRYRDDSDPSLGGM